MSRKRKTKEPFDQALAAIEAQHGVGAIRRASEIVRDIPHISTGFSALDSLTGCSGVPLEGMTLLTGVNTSGKVTIAYKTIASAQQVYPKQVMVLIDLHLTADPDYYFRTGVDTSRLLLLQPSISNSAVDALVDSASDPKVRLIVVNSLADFQADQSVYRYLTSMLGRLNQALWASHSALIWIDDPSPPWLRWLNLDQINSIRQFALLHIEMQFERELTNDDGEMYGYMAQAKLHKSKWTRAGKTVHVAIEFNGTVRARDTW